MLNSLRLSLIGLALAAGSAAVSAAVTDTEFRSVSEVLYRQWSADSGCVEPKLSLSVQASAEERVLEQQIQQHRVCLSRFADKISRRKSAQTLVNPDVWSQLSDDQRTQLQTELARFNKELLASTAKRWDDFGDVVEEATDALQARVEQERQAQEAARAELEKSFASVSQVRACARRMESLKKTESALDEAHADLKSDELGMQMRKTELIGLKFSASALDYNAAVDRYNYSLTQFDRKVDRYNEKVRAYKRQSSSYEEDCSKLRFSRQTRDAVCDDESFPAFCATIKAR
jgi:hypothetical protein